MACSCVCMGILILVPSWHDFLSAWESLLGTCLEGDKCHDWIGSTLRCDKLRYKLATLKLGDDDYWQIKGGSKLDISIGTGGQEGTS